MGLSFSSDSWLASGILQPCTAAKCKLCLARKQRAGIKVGLNLVISQSEVADEERRMDRDWLILVLYRVQLLELPGSADCC